MQVADMYGIAVAFTVLAAWASRDHVLHKLALVLLVAWASTNIAVAAGGFAAFPLAFPSIEAACALTVACVGYANRSPVALVVFILYGWMLAAHLGAYVGELTDSYAYRATINAIFAGQLLVVGGPSAWLALRHWVPSGDQRFRLVRSRR